MPFVLSSFLNLWRNAIKEADQHRQPLLLAWEGKQACSDLKRAGLLHAAGFEKDEELGFNGEADWRSKLQFQAFEAAVAIYEADAKELSNSAEKDSAIRIFAEAVNKLRPLVDARYGREMKEQATVMLRLLETERSRRVQRSRGKRNELFFASVGALSGALRELVKAPSRGFDLDSRFQRTIGFLFTIGLRNPPDGSRGVKFRTISRLVLLFYLASGLATYRWDDNEQSGTVETLETKKRLEVLVIDQNLRRAKLHEFDQQKTEYRD